MRIDCNFYKPILDKFVYMLKEQLKEDLISVVLYGSVARGDAGSISDVDILIIWNKAPANYHERLRTILAIQHRVEKEKVYSRIQNILNVPIQLSYLVFSKEEADDNKYIYLDIMEDGITLYDKDNFLKFRLEKLRKRLQELDAKRCFLRDGTWYWDLNPALRVGEVFSL